MQCARHPDAEARFACRDCRRMHCSTCLKRVKAGTAFLDACPDCDGMVDVAIKPVEKRARVADLLARLVCPEGLLMALALAVPAWAAAIPVLSIFMGVAYLAGMASYYFLVVDHVGRGRTGLPMPSEGLDSWGAMGGTIGRGLVCVAMAAIPVGGYFAIHGVGRAPDASTLLTALALIAVGIAYLPAVILAVVISETTWGALWPPLWIRIAARAPEQYLRLVGLFAASTLAFWCGTLTALFLLGPIRIFGGLLATAVANLIIMGQAALIGDFLQRNSEAFGYDALG